MSIATPPAAEPLTLAIVFTEFNRIFKSTWPLFLTLSFLFLIPSSTYLSIYPLLTFHHRLFAGIFTGLLFTCGVATITYTTYHRFFNRSITLASAIKSLRHSFLPIVFTTSVAVIFATFSTFLFVFALEFIKKGLSHSFLPLVFVTILILLIIPLQVHCALRIAINEPNWRFVSEWLKGSKLFTSKFKRIPLKFVMFFVLQYFNIDYCLWGEPVFFKLGWLFALFLIFLAFYYALAMFYYISSVTVLYTFLKDSSLDEETNLV